ncbi:hypothetical protein HXX76_015194 [Chlamydomonas incerta]|uniref:GCK domain-containing protein n=1 Tax=Chlamydomonas incerta TaxID=51695 RepID=A0A835VNP2_CHLIN|nr:hypothetical protein HXX76_015194 [Chlamydomonas incerta]|eukprot:KAG2423552.1 hypothetical protein HXX76_015194 [Chlamydomonas incerta]
MVSTPPDASTSEAKAATEPEPSAPAENGEEGGEPDPARCPICQFIEAGECGGTHKEWVACRDEAKAAGKDYIDECQDKFKAFLQCAVTHRDYYAPFLEMLGGVPGPEDEEGDEGGEGEGKEGKEAEKEAAGAAGAGSGGRAEGGAGKAERGGPAR